jgi:hypothetical protein
MGFGSIRRRIRIFLPHSMELIDHIPIALVSYLKPY